MTATSPHLHTHDDAPATLSAHLSDRLLALADRHRRAVFAVILLAYVAGFNGQWRPEPDAALYLSIGRNLAEGKGYTYHDAPHHLAYPGLPWMWAGVFAAAGRHGVPVAHAAMLAIGLACLALTYRLFLLHAGRPTAVLMVTGLAVSRMFYRYCYELRSDVPFLLGVLAFLCGYEAIFYAGRARARATAGEAKVAPSSSPLPSQSSSSPYRARWFDWALLIAGIALAVVMRPTMWALLAAIVVATARLLFIGHVRWGLVALAAFVGVAAAFWQFDPRRSGPGGGMGEYEQTFLDVTVRAPEFARHVLTVNLPGLFEPAAAEAMFGLDMGPGLNTLGSLAAIAAGASLLWRRVLWGMFYLFTVGMMLLVLPLDRYFLPVLPLTVYGWWRGLVWLDHRLPPRVAPYAFAALFLMGSATNFCKVCEWAFQQHRRPFLATYKSGRFADGPRLGRAIEALTPERSWVISPTKTGRILTFYSRRNVNEAGPLGADSLQQLAEVNRGYVLNPGDDGVKAWLAQTPLKLAPAIYTIKRDGQVLWALHPVTKLGLKE